MGGRAGAAAPAAVLGPARRQTGMPGRPGNAPIGVREAVLLDRPPVPQPRGDVDRVEVAPVLAPVGVANRADPRASSSRSTRATRSCRRRRSRSSRSSQQLEIVPAPKFPAFLARRPLKGDAEESRPARGTGGPRNRPFQAHRSAQLGVSSTDPQLLQTMELGGLEPPTS